MWRGRIRVAALRLITSYLFRQPDPVTAITDLLVGRAHSAPSFRRISMSNRSVLIGLVAGIGVAAAGGVAAYQFLGDRNNQSDVAVVKTAARPAPVVAAVPKQECWDEEVVVQLDPKDQHAIAGTAGGAVVGGAIGKNVGDDKDLVTVAGAAAGAYIGRRIQKKMQDNRADTRTETHIERRCGPVGTPH
jgi:uncharacterized protein YcfJ